MGVLFYKWANPIQIRINVVLFAFIRIYANLYELVLLLLEHKKPIKWKFYKNYYIDFFEFRQKFN